jgi:hypothetical protein
MNLESEDEKSNYWGQRKGMSVLRNSVTPHVRKDTLDRLELMNLESEDEKSNYWGQCKSMSVLQKSVTPHVRKEKAYRVPPLIDIFIKVKISHE